MARRLALAPWLCALTRPAVALLRPPYASIHDRYVGVFGSSRNHSESRADLMRTAGDRLALFVSNGVLHASNLTVYIATANASAPGPREWWGHWRVSIRARGLHVRLQSLSDVTQAIDTDATTARFGRESAAVLDIALAAQARVFQGTAMSTYTSVVGWLQANRACAPPSERRDARSWLAGEMPALYLCVRGACIVHSSGVSLRECRQRCTRAVPSNTRNFGSFR